MRWQPMVSPGLLTAALVDTHATSFAAAPATVGPLSLHRAHPGPPVPSSLGDHSVSMKHAPPSRPPITLVYRLMAGVRRKRRCAARTLPQGLHDSVSDTGPTATTTLTPDGA